MNLQPCGFYPAELLASASPTPNTPYYADATDYQVWVALTAVLLDGCFIHFQTSQCWGCTAEFRHGLCSQATYGLLGKINKQVN